MFWFKKILTPIVAISFIVLILSVLLPSLLESTYVAPVVVREQSQVAAIQAILVSHLATPEPLKAIYMTACVAGTPSWREDLKKLIETKELNDAGIYAIVHISVFQDPVYTKLFPELAVKSKSNGEVWKDYKKLSFVDVGAKPYWDYIVELSERAYALGFDELNYDYVRYPSDGNMTDTLYTWTVGTTTKPEMLKSFFEY